MRTQTSWLSQSPEETIEYGAGIAKLLHPGSVAALEGDLGSGKTTLIKGIALGLGVKSKREVKSPTFVIMHVYQGRIPLYHFDLYRLDEQSDLEGIGIEEFINDCDSVSVIEWADRIPHISKRADLVIKLANKGNNKREIKVYKNAPFLQTWKSREQKQHAGFPRTRG